MRSWVDKQSLVTEMTAAYLENQDGNYTRYFRTISQVAELRMKERGLLNLPGE